MKQISKRSPKMTKRATNRASSINVQRVDEIKCTTKRVLIPSTIGLLRKAIKAAFKIDQQIVSLKAEDGMDIISIHDVVPDNMIYVSFTQKAEIYQPGLKENKNKIDQNAISTPTSKCTKTPKSALKKNPALEIPKPNKHIRIAESQNEDDTEIINIVPSPAAFNENKNVNKTPDRIPKNKGISKTPDIGGKGKLEENLKISKSPNKTPNQNRKSFIPIHKSLQPKKLNMPAKKQEEFEDSESNSETPQEPEEIDEKIKDTKESEDADMENKTVINKTVSDEKIETEPQLDEKQNTLSKGEEKVEDRSSNFEEEDIEMNSIFSTMFEPSIAEAVSNALNAISPKERSFINDAYNAEMKQISWWLNQMQSIINSEIADPTNDRFVHVDELVSSAKSFIENHRIQIGSGFIHNFQATLIGESKSGKSTYLSILSRELLLNLASSGEWKYTFVVPINLELVSSNDPGVLYSKMVRHTMRLAAIQSPFIRFDFKHIEEAFCRVIGEHPTTHLPNHILQDTPIGHLLPAIQGLVDSYHGMYHDSSQLQKWIDSSVAFPVKFSQVLGFRRVIWLIDNADLYDFEVMPNHIFCDSLYNRNTVESLKEVIALSPYIITGKNTERLQNILPHTSEFTANIYSITEFIPVCNFVQNPRKLPPITVALNDLKQPITLTAQTCCGIPSYLSQLYQLHSLIDERDEAEEGSYDREELDAEVETFTEEVLLYLFEFDKSLSIKSISRNKDSN